MRVKTCAWPGCYSMLSPGPQRYCAKHALAGEKRDAEIKAVSTPFAHAERPNARLYNTARWRALRAAHLKTAPECVNCGAIDELSVDHICPPRGDEALFFDPENLQTLCMSCQRMKTVAEITARRGNRR